MTRDESTRRIENRPAFGRSDHLNFVSPRKGEVRLLGREARTHIAESVLRRWRSTPCSPPFLRKGRGGGLDGRDCLPIIGLPFSVSRLPSLAKVATAAMYFLPRIASSMVEQETLNLLVVGSSPTRCIVDYRYLQQLRYRDERRTSQRLRSLADYIQPEGPFDFSFSRRVCAGSSSPRPRSIQEGKQ